MLHSLRLRKCININQTLCRMIQEKKYDTLCQFIGDQIANFNEINITTAYSKILFMDHYIPNIAYICNILENKIVKIETNFCLREYCIILNAICKRGKRYEFGRNLLECLEGRMNDLAIGCRGRDLSTVFWSYAKLKSYPLKTTIDTIENGISLLCCEINANGIGKILWAYTEIGLLPNMKVFDAIQENIIKIENYVSSADIFKVLVAISKIGIQITNECKRMLDLHVANELEKTKIFRIQDIVYSYSIIKIKPCYKTKTEIIKNIKKTIQSIEFDEICVILWGACSLFDVDNEFCCDILCEIDAFFEIYETYGDLIVHIKKKIELSQVILSLQYEDNLSVNMPHFMKILETFEPPYLITENIQLNDRHIEIINEIENTLQKIGYAVTKNFICKKTGYCATLFLYINTFPVRGEYPTENPFDIITRRTEFVVYIQEIEDEDQNESIRTRLKKRHMKLAGYNNVNISFSDWNTNKNQKNTIEYITSRIYQNSYFNTLLYANTIAPSVAHQLQV